MATKYKLQDTAQLLGKNVFVDANIIIYLFWPTGQHNFEKNYARVFSALRKQGTKLFVDFLVISEVINRVVRIEHKKTETLNNTPTQSFKDFRNSQHGKNALNDIYLIIKDDILTNFHITGKAFDMHAIDGFLVVDELDFVDKSIVAICKENDFVLLTNDKDFKNSSIEIITGNHQLLNA